MAFSQAIELEGDQPGRYIAYAKALEKIGERHKATEALETAYSLNPSTVVLRHLLELYENASDVENIELTRKRIDELQAAKEQAATKAAKPKRRIIKREPKAPKPPKERKAKKATNDKQAKKRKII